MIIEDTKIIDKKLLDKSYLTRISTTDSRGRVFSGINYDILSILARIDTFTSI